MSTTPAPITECENGAPTDVETGPGRRGYLDPEAPDDREAASVDDDIEAWCASCVANYPHLGQR